MSRDVDALLCLRDGEGESMDKRCGWWMLVLACAISCVLPAYVGAYYALCVPSPGVCTPLRLKFTVSRYRNSPLGQQRCQWLFAPIHQLDRRLRPQVWYCESY